MEKLPHRYEVLAANDTSTSEVTISAAGIPTLMSAPPKQFGGPGDKWSPEDLLIAAVADCFVLSFRAVARASKLEWETLQCSVEGILDRIDGVTQFTEIFVKPSLTILNADKLEFADKVLHKAEKNCLITNSLSSKVTLNIESVTTK